MDQQTQDNPPEQTQPDQPVQSGLIEFGEPVGIADLQETMAVAEKEPVPEVTAAVTQEPEQNGPVVTADPSVPVGSKVEITEEQLRELMRMAHLDNSKKDFYDKLMAARHPKTEAPVPLPPIPVRVAEQTRLEMEAGQKRVADHAATQATRPPMPRKEKWDGSSTPVFRPNDYVPDPKKGQGYVGARPLSA